MRGATKYAMLTGGGHGMTRSTQSRRKPGFLGFVKKLVEAMQEDDCTGQAAQLAYYFLFAMFPFLLFLTALLGYIPIPNLMDHIINLLAGLLPEQVASLLRGNVQQLVTTQNGGLLSFGIIAALWSASTAIVALMTNLNRAYDVQEGRPFWKVRGLALLLTIGLAFFVVVSMVLLMFGPQIGGWVASQVGVGEAFSIAWNILRWPVIVFFLVLALALLYYFAPDVDQRWTWITPGSVFAVLATLAVSLGFSYYVNNFGAYNKTYGSIGGVIVLLTWLYLTGLFFLIGGEMNAEIEHTAQEGKEPEEKTAA
jgi:membrane protein